MRGCIGLSSLNCRNWRPVFILLSILVEILSMGLTGAVSYELLTFSSNLPSIPVGQLVQFSSWFGVLLIGVGLFIGLYRGAFHLNNRRMYLLAGRV